MFRRRPAPARATPQPRLLVEELEPRVLFSADAEAVLPGLSWQADQTAGPQVETTLVSAHQVRSTQDAATTGSQAEAPRHEVAFVDGGIDNADQLIALLQQQAQADGRVLDVVRLDANADGLQQIGDWLAQHQDLDAVHVFSHGQAGSLQLGSAVLDSTTLAERAGELVQWSQAFGEDGDLLLYGCDLAASAEGRQLLSDLSLLTGADVAASDDRTGASALGGDWVLEQRVGQVETAVALGEGLQTQWQGVLATATFQQVVSSYTGTQDTVINSAAPNTADGSNTLLNMLNANNDAKQVLLRFDNLFSSGGGSIPDGSVITSATVRLYITEDGTGDAYLHRILAANWDESSTWNSLTNGISIDNVEASSTSAGANDLSSKNVYTTFTVTSTVQAWANGASNLGWMLYTDGNEVAFASSENGTSAYRPLLTINYTAPTPPAVDLNGGVAGTGYSASYFENTPVNITSSTLATVTAGTNGVSPNLSGMTVTISNIQNAGLESLLADVTGTNISKSYNATTGVLTLSGSDTAANYQQVLRTIQYDNASDHPSTTTRTINFVAMDPYGGNSATATASVTVTRVNDAPVITSNGGGATANVNVNETLTSVTTVVATDAEGSAITYSLGGIDASLFNLNSSTGVLTFKNAPDFENPQDSGGNNVYNVTVYASDSLLLDQQDIAITVLDMPTTLVVDTTADTNDTGLGTGFNVEQLNASKGTDGKVSLREAIIAANNTAGLNTVTFSITGSTGAYGEYTITLSSTLPTISEAIYLNAATQAGYSTHPLIVLDGEGGSGHGFTLNSTADGSTIRGFVIRDFSADGIHIDSGSDNHTIVGNYIGSFNADGSNAGTGERNASEGIESYGANVLIGGTTAADRNVISGNASAYNIYLASGANGTTVSGNYIGTDAAGTSAFTSTNSAHGIMLETSASNVTIGGTAAGAGNVISGFSNRGVWVTTTGTVTVQGNKIGTDVTGTVDLGNTGYGLYVDDGGTVTVGGTAAGAGNLVSGNDGGGIYIGGSVTATVQGNMLALMLSLSTAGLLVYYFYLRRMLQHLDPSQAIPERVRAAFDALAEGLLVLDHQQRIMLTNEAFSRLYPSEGAQLGRPVSELAWLNDALGDAAKNPPWLVAMKTREPVLGVQVRITGEDGQARQALMNCAAICDAKGAPRGCVVTLDDVTELDRANVRLREALGELERSHDRIQTQNVELEKLANHDPMTGCLNRRAFYARAEPLFSRAREQGTPLACIMSDIDKFKNFNDTHGHAVGDQVIQQVAALLKTSLRPEDLLCRYGGEEFCIVLPNTPLPEALRVAQRMRARMEAEAGPGVTSVAGLRITSSFGVCTLPESQVASLDKLIEQADAGLYAAKKAGRNRVRYAPGVQASLDVVKSSAA